jgi:hypothetical protein
MGIFTRKQSTAPVSAPEAEGEEYAVMPKALRISAASFMGHAPVSDNEVEKVPMAEVFPITAAINKGERTREAAQKKAEEDAKKNLRPGYKAGDRGVFVGTVEPKDRNGKSLGVKLNLFAAPEDLYPADTSGKNCRTFVDTAKEIGNRPDGLKLDPEHYEEGLIAAIKDRSAFGKWIIPFREWVDGKDRDGTVVLEKNNLYALRNEGDFSGKFTTEDKAPSPMIPNRYWSCTEHRDYSTHVWDVRFSDGDDDWGNKGNDRLSCRPCRVELAL